MKLSKNFFLILKTMNEWQNVKFDSFFFHPAVKNFKWFPRKKGLNFHAKQSCWIFFFFFFTCETNFLLFLLLVWFLFSVFFFCFNIKFRIWGSLLPILNFPSSPPFPNCQLPNLFLSFPCIYIFLERRFSFIFFSPSKIIFSLHSLPDLKFFFFSWNFFAYFLFCDFLIWIPLSFYCFSNCFQKFLLVFSHFSLKFYLYFFICHFSFISWI